MKIGVRLESLGLPMRQVVPRLSKLGVEGVQLDISGDLLPDKLSQSGRRELRHLFEAHDLELTALGCPLRYGLDVAENQDARIDHVRKIMTLSYELGPRIVIVQAGKTPEKPDDPAGRILGDSLTALGQHGDRGGTILALEAGLESGAVLAEYLGRFNSGGLGVNFDPHNLMVHRFDPYDSATALHGRIVHAHAHDARQASPGRSTEVPLGHGDIDWLRLTDIFEEIEYRGWLVIEREQDKLSLEEAAAGVGFLRRLVR